MAHRDAEKKQCPFCGSHNIRWGELERGYPYFYITCDDCKATGPVEGSITVAWDSWNKRGPR